MIISYLYTTTCTTVCSSMMCTTLEYYKFLTLQVYFRYCFMLQYSKAIDSMLGLTIRSEKFLFVENLSYNSTGVLSQNTVSHYECTSESFLKLLLDSTKKLKFFWTRKKLKALLSSSSAKTKMWYGVSVLQLIFWVGNIISFYGRMER